MSQGSLRPIRSSRQRDRKTKSFELLQVVYLQETRPDLGLARGECGTIVEILAEPYPACLVEFIDDAGVTRVEAALAPEELSASPPL